jgi:hypothetical protein
VYNGAEIRVILIYLQTTVYQRLDIAHRAGDPNYLMCEYVQQRRQVQPTDSYSVLSS